MKNKYYTYIETNKFQELINKLKEEKTNMETYFNLIKKDGDQMINYWSGDTGKNASETFAKHTATYEDILNNIEAKIIYLENTLEDYILWEQETGAAIDSNSEIEMGS
jgi:hypothetical protein